MTISISDETGPGRDQGHSVADENEATGTAHAIAPAAPDAVGKFALKPDDIEQEPLLKPNLRRFTLFPIQYPDIWEMYKKVSSTDCFRFLPTDQLLQRRKRHFGRQKSLTYRKIQLIGTNSRPMSSSLSKMFWLSLLVGHLNNLTGQGLTVLQQAMESSTRILWPASVTNFRSLKPEPTTHSSHSLRRFIPVRGTESADLTAPF
jgi:hypothetical protein